MYTREELLNAIDRYIDEFGEQPSSADMSAAEGYPSEHTFKNRFGSWNEAVEAAGLDPVLPGEPKLPVSVDGVSINEYDRGPVQEAIVATEITFNDGANLIRLSFPQRMPVAGVSFIAETAMGAVDSTGTFEWLVALTASDRAIDRYLPLSDLPDVVDEPIIEIFE